MGLVGMYGWLDVISPLVPAPVKRAIVIQYLRAYYHRLCTSDMFRNAAEQNFKDIVLWYSEEHRVYHTLEHIVDVLGKIDRYTPKFSSSWKDDALRFAAFYHDAVNTGKRSRQSDCRV
jgi:predicted metal-dependent HD superfamily phosphohydrolase